MRVGVIFWFFFSIPKRGSVPKEFKTSVLKRPLYLVYAKNKLASCKKKNKSFNSNTLNGSQYNFQMVDWLIDSSPRALVLLLWLVFLSVCFYMGQEYPSVNGHLVIWHRSKDASLWYISFLFHLAQGLF